MARYNLFGLSNSLFESNVPGPIGPRLLYVSATEFGIQNADGSRTYFHGTGFVWDETEDSFLDGGIVTAVSHYDAAGQFIDSLASLDETVLTINMLLHSDIIGFEHSLETLLIGDDVIDARFRVGNAVIDDELNGYWGNDVIRSGSGNDSVLGGLGDDRLWGGSGGDRLLGDGERSMNGNDRLHGEGGNDILYGGLGNDLTNGGNGIDTAVFSGTFANLTIIDTVFGFRVLSRDGSDALINVERIGADDGIYSFDAATGQWTKIGNTAGATLLDPSALRVLTAGDDTANYNVNNDASARVVYGLAGNDNITFQLPSGDGLVFGGAGNDMLKGGGNFYGQDGNDTLDGGGVLDGGAGKDDITGFNSVMTGGGGADVFNFDITDHTSGHFSWQSGWGDNVITDFQLDIDHINLTRNGGAFFGDLTLTDTADGILLTYELAQVLSPPKPTTILFRGLHGDIALDDLLA